MIPSTLSHFRVLDQIGAGGMGVVYRAHDEQLDRDVALKVLPADLFANDSARRRFRREALALGKLNHPNVGAVYEFGGQDGVDFLVMELVSGTPLDVRLASGPMADDDIVRLGRQLAEGLEAAHAEGIIHRDLKPGNLRLTADGRLKILDFGLAQMVQQSDLAPTITAIETPHLSGTLAYMAPEQLRGRDADVRTDIYSAGTVLYEMATGKRPFATASGLALMSAILEGSPPSPRSQNTRLSPALETIILKALDRNPELRYQSARELRVDLERHGQGGLRAAARAKRPRVIALAAIAALVIVTLLAGLIVSRVRDRASPAPPAAAVASRRSLAVLGFKNLSGRQDEAWISTAIAEMLTTEMAAGEQLRTISGEDVVRTKLDLALTDGDTFGRDTLGRIRGHLGSDLLVLGSYLALGKESGGRIRLDFRLQDTVSGETVAAASESGTEDGLIDLVTRAGAELRQRLGIEPLSASGASVLRASLPSNPEAARLYAEGLARLRVFEALQARELLERAVAADPDHAPAHSALAAAWSALGYDNRAQEQAKLAIDRSSDLSREERLSIEGRYREFSRDWMKAIDIYRTLSGFFPDSLDYGLRLAAAQVSAGQSKDALTTLEGLQRLPLPAKDDARLDLAESRAAAALGDFGRARDAARRAVAKGRAQGARLVIAQARFAEGFPLERLGQLNEANEAFAEAKALSLAAGDRLGAALAVQFMGNVFLDRGDFASARASYEDALNVFRQLGTQQRAASSLNNIGNVLYDQGSLVQARHYYEEAIRIDRDIGDKRGLAGALGNLANVLDGIGDLAGARRLQEEGLAAFREVGDKRGIASTLNNLGNLLAELGELAEARLKFEESLGIATGIGYKRGQAYSKFSLADVLGWQDELDAARATAESALALRTEMHDDNNAAWSRLQLAGIALERQHDAEAEQLARDAAGAFDRLKAPENSAVANAVLAAILVDRRRLAEARRAADRASALLPSNPSLQPRLESSLANARVLAASGSTIEAARALDAILADAKSRGYVAFEYQARLLQGQLEIASGRTAAGRAHLNRLERDARATGYRLIARKAAALGVPAK